MTSYLERISEPNGSNRTLAIQTFIWTEGRILQVLPFKYFFSTVMEKVHMEVTFIQGEAVW